MGEGGGSGPAGDGRTQEEIDEARGTIKAWVEEYPAEKGVFSDELLQMRMKEEFMKAHGPAAFPVNGDDEFPRRRGSAT